MLGWRPAPGLVVPHRPNWVLSRKLGEGGFGEVWLAEHKKTRDGRVLKFCFELERVRALQREVTVCRLLREALGNRPDIARILDWNFDEAPYFLEFEYTEGGNLLEWIEAQGGFAAVPLAARLEIAAQVAEAIAAAHSVGVLHKDIKPANILVTPRADGPPQARVTDFGIGLVTDGSRLADYGITVLGMTDLGRPQTLGSQASGTRIYMAPEVLEGRPATTQADIYSLGVLVYQLAVGDFAKALAPGWERDVDDEVLRDDVAAFVDGRPERRVASAIEVARRLRSLDARRAAARGRPPRRRAGGGGPARARAGTAPPPRRGRRRRRGRAVRRRDGGPGAAGRRRGGARQSRGGRRPPGDRFPDRPLRGLGPERGQGQQRDRARDPRPRRREDRQGARRPAGGAGEDEGRDRLGLPPARPARAGRPSSCTAPTSCAAETLGAGDLETADSVHDLGWLAEKQGNWAEAEKRYREALALRRAKVAEDDEQAAKILDDLGYVNVEQAHYDEALEDIRAGLGDPRTARGRRLARGGRQPHHPRLRPLPARRVPAGRRPAAPRGRDPREAVRTRLVGGVERAQQPGGAAARAGRARRGAPSSTSARSPSRRRCSAPSTRTSARSTTTSASLEQDLGTWRNPSASSAAPSPCGRRASASSTR